MRRWTRLVVCVLWASAQACGSSGGGAEGTRGGATGGAGAGAAGGAGTGAAAAGTSGAAGAGGDAMPASTSGPAGDQNFVSTKGKCEIASGFPGDEACLLPPEPDEGFQIHVGPADYNDMAQLDEFTFLPQQESSECYMKKTPNTEEITYFQFELSGRPGTHHIINTLWSAAKPDGWGVCEQNFFGPQSGRIGSLGGASRAYMPPMPIAPENEGLGIKLGPNVQAQFDMHYFNFTEKPILREFWLNVYYKDPATVKEQPIGIMGLGGLSWALMPIQPGTHQTYTYDCPINADGRVIELLGHTHSHAVRETAWIRQGGGDMLEVFEQFDYLEPQIFYYDSVQKNPAFSEGSPGAFTGILDVKKGDALVWECEVDNDSTTPLRYVNELKTGEMCNIWGSTVGPALNCIKY